MQISTELARLQVFKYPGESGRLALQAYWQEVVTIDANTPPIIGNQLKELVTRNYPSLEAANEAALASPGFAAIAAQFAVKPFTTICDLLEALRAMGEAERAAQPEPELDLPPFPGAP